MTHHGLEMLKGKTQITVVNNEKLYNLLSLVTAKAKKKEEESSTQEIG